MIIPNLKKRKAKGRILKTFTHTQLMLLLIEVNCMLDFFMLTNDSFQNINDPQEVEGPLNTVNQNIQIVILL